MIKISLKRKIIFPSVMVLFSLVVIMTAYSSLEFYRFTTVLKSENVMATAANLKSYLGKCEHNSLMAAVSAAKFPEVIRVINDRNTAGIIEVLNPYVEAFDITYFTVTDQYGNVLARTYNPLRLGDNVSAVQNIKDAMNGKVSTYYESGPVIDISIHTGAPVYNSSGVLTGIISAGVRLDENQFVDRLKERFDVDFSIFLGNTRIVTTIIKDGERIGTRLDLDITDEMQEDITEYFYNYNLFGEYYSAFVHPLVNANNEVFAMMVVDISNEQIIAERNWLIMYNAFIGIAGLIFAIIVLLHIVIRITRPINSLVTLVSDVTQGNLNIDNNNIDKKIKIEDEIDLLSADIYLLIDVIKSVLNDLSHLTSDLNNLGDIEFQIDSSKYSGSYKEIIDGINELCKSISIKNKTMAAMDFLDTMITVTDFNYNILYLNKAMIDAYGINVDNYFKQKCYKAIYNYDKPCPHCKMKELVEKKDSFPTTEYEYRLDECLGKWIGGRSAIIPWIDGSKVLCNYYDDETQVKDFEEKLRETAHNAQAASVAKSVFLANMSHEIRTPMNSIMGFSELAMDDNIPVRTREYLSKILENTKGLLQIVNDILDISKVESGKMELENIPFNLHELLASCRTLILPKAVEKGITIYFYAEPSIGKMPLGDPTRLKQVFINLLSNAIKFTNTGTVKVFAEIRQRTEDTVTMYFEVKDSGIGMTQEQIEKIVDPFMQGESGTTRKYGGTGLGLTITKSIVELMGGDLVIESMPGVGSKFSFSLVFGMIDTSNDDVYMNKAVFDEYDKPLFEGEVLLCEDNAMNQQVICEHLARVGLKTVVAWNGRIGLDMVRSRVQKKEKQFDLILMDMHMPVMDGLDASARIMELDTGIPMVALTANVMSDDKDIYRQSGLNDCVGKPFTSQELWRCLLKYLTPKNKKIRISNKNNELLEQDGCMETDLEFQKSLESLFVRSNQNKYNEIIEALERDDIKLAHRLVHSLKSNAGQIGKNILQKAAANVEFQLKDGSKRVTEEQLRNLETEFKIVLTELAPLMDDIHLEQSDNKSDGQKDVLDKESSNELIGILLQLLKTGNPECLNKIDSFSKVPVNEALKIQLIQQMEDFDFESALTTLGKIKDEIS